MAEYQAFSIRREHFESDIHLLLERVEAQVRMFASLGRRLGAFIIDLLPALAITFASGGNFWMFWAFLVLYHWLLVGFFRQTLGKLLMGIRVESSQPPLKRWIFALARPLFGYPIMVFSGIGAIQLILHPQHVGIHDRLFHTQIRQIRKLPWAAGLGRIDRISYSFDEWLLKLLAGVGLGSIMQWAGSFFGIDQPVKWVRNIFKNFGVGTASSTQIGTGIASVGTLLVVAPPLVVGLVLTVLLTSLVSGVTSSVVATPTRIEITIVGVSGSGGLIKSEPGQPSEVRWEELGSGSIHSVTLSGCDPRCNGTLEIPSNIPGNLYVEGNVWGECSFENITLSSREYELLVRWYKNSEGEYDVVRCDGDCIGAVETTR